MVFRNSELVCGVLDKNTLGGGNKNNLFHVLLRDFSPEIAADCMSRVAKMCARWTGTQPLLCLSIYCAHHSSSGNQGFSIGISDVTPSPLLTANKNQMVTTGYANCNQLIQDAKDGKLLPAPGCTVDQTLEVD